MDTGYLPSFPSVQNSARDSAATWDDWSSCWLRWHFCRWLLLTFLSPAMQLWIWGHGGCLTVLCRANTQGALPAWHGDSPNLLCPQGWPLPGGNIRQWPGLGWSHVTPRSFSIVEQPLHQAASAPHPHPKSFSFYVSLRKLKNNQRRFFFFFF